MQKFSYPATRGLDLIFIRLYGSGLANLLLSWAVCYLNEHDKRRIVKPTFFNISFGQILRGEYRNQVYFNYFPRCSYIGGIRRIIIMFADKVSRMFGITLMTKYIGEEKHVPEIMIRRDVIVAELLSIVPERILLKLDQLESRRICVHIRLTDFKKVHNNFVDKYRVRLKGLAESYPDLPIYIYTDGKVEEIESLIREFNAVYVVPSSALDDLICMSKCKVFVGTQHSTYSMWACIVGNHSLDSLI